jgi:hypothetical protein
MAGNTALLIWLGKQYLGQVEKSETKLDASAIQINIDNVDNTL